MELTLHCFASAPAGAQPWQVQKDAQQQQQQPGSSFRPNSSWGSPGAQPEFLLCARKKMTYRLTCMSLVLQARRLSSRSRRILGIRLQMHRVSLEGSRHRLRPTLLQGLVDLKATCSYGRATNCDAPLTHCDCFFAAEPIVRSKISIVSTGT